VIGSVAPASRARLNVCSKKLAAPRPELALPPRSREPTTCQCRRPPLPAGDGAAPACEDRASSSPGDAVERAGVTRLKLHKDVLNVEGLARCGQTRWPSPQSARVGVNAVTVGQRRADQRHRHVPNVRSARVAAQIDVHVEQFHAVRDAAPTRQANTRPAPATRASRRRSDRAGRDCEKVAPRRCPPTRGTWLASEPPSSPVRGPSRGCPASQGDAGHRIRASSM